MLSDPDIVGQVIDYQTLRVAVAVAPYLWLDAILADERVVLGNAAVIMNPIHRAVVVGEILCWVRCQVTAGRCLAITGCNEQVTVRIEGKATSVMSIAL